MKKIFTDILVILFFVAAVFLFPILGLVWGWIEKRRKNHKIPADGYEINDD